MMLSTSATLFADANKAGLWYMHLQHVVMCTFMKPTLKPLVS